ncbi:hypothetical protein [Amycolatopsis alba]|uniref:Sigma-70 family RNA polymerase sigma factor n=1 Tax=Amycolatopsis alba DSM 44262 TaxID=1125972 RepID=A0A229R9C3_AMYAL|nr:hypothetical protein [Amycolatopsis alba]OXM43061.1 hypothetical protein CFP75_40170 [Amycolatopsis alba DSM 44262]
MSEDIDDGAEILRRFIAAYTETVAAIDKLEDPGKAARVAHQVYDAHQKLRPDLADLRTRWMKAAGARMTNKELAVALQISEARVSQLVPSPPPYRALFGDSGTVHIGYPVRHGITDLDRPLVAGEDAATTDALSSLLSTLGVEVDRFQVVADETKVPDGDTVLICGPKTAPVAGRLIERDPALTMLEEGGRWWIEVTSSAARYGSPSDQPEPQQSDVAYLARHVMDDRVIIHIAGIHSIGSLGAAHHLAGHVAALHKKVRKTQFSAIIRCTFEDRRITGTDMLAGPFTW